LVRRMDRESQQEHLRTIFNKYDNDKSGAIAIKEISKLFGDLGITPRTRKEQLEIRMIFDEVDENGDGEFAFQEFELLIQRVQERLDRLARLDEEEFALQIGLPLQRCREIRKLFQDNVSGGTQLLFVSELRTVMNQLQRRYSSEELLNLFEAFGRQDNGGVDAKGFLRMIHAIEVARTHGQIVKNKKSVVYAPGQSPMAAMVSERMVVKARTTGDFPRMMDMDEE